MDTTPQVTDEMKKQIYAKLYDDLIRGLEKGDMTTNDSEESCAFIVDELDNAKTKEDILLFLQALATRWPSYQNAYLIVRGDILQIQDQQKAKGITDELHKLISNL